MAIHIVLIEPEIPPNTGNIARSCAATGSILHLVEPLGFSIDDKSLKRAGLDYWPFVEVHVHENIDIFLSENRHKNFYLATTKGKNRYSDITFQDDDMILFGKETAGLPEDLISQYPGNAIRIPMSSDTRLRSLNLSNAVNIVLFEALRQMDFPGLV